MLVHFEEELKKWFFVWYLHFRSEIERIDFYKEHNIKLYSRNESVSMNIFNSLQTIIR